MGGMRTGFRGVGGAVGRGFTCGCPVRFKGSFCGRLGEMLPSDWLPSDRLPFDW